MTNPELPAMKTLEYTGACFQARNVGGDYYDFLELRPGRLALVNRAPPVSMTRQCMHCAG